ncbi:Zn2 DNA-binding protein [Venustampulla echinocandica]|uniref:Zn2 DNA-binding protein n=1 Tax=Venustampulla echinocandica TaxID=2656787 RepID=A0A370U1T8_9HELO|nr:Zn2 DNA-binding protein [Venustampulla echinocandica]RDL41750.1 Zn2 DNA-binding protein [Venustampulla echinocandica]
MFRVGNVKSLGAHASRRALLQVSYRHRVSGWGILRAEYLLIYNPFLTAASSPDNPSPSGSRSTPDIGGSDRNSIGFLLNGEGERDFMREFPKSTTLSPPSHAAEYQNLMNIAESIEPPDRSISQAPSAYDEYGQLLPENNLNAMLSNLEFGNFERQTQNWQMPGESMIPWSGPGVPFLDRNILEQRAFDIREKLRYTAAAINPPNPASKEVLDAIELITAERIAVNTKLYFRHWHKHAPMVHEPSFNPCVAALPLVLAVMSVGGMYSKESDDVEKLKLLLDTIECYVFSIPGISDEYDLPGRTYIVQGGNSSADWQQYQMEELQGAYLMIVLQFWTGNPIARIRVRQQRFQRIVSIFHHLELQAVQHSPTFQITDQQSFRSWIRKESYIRTVTLAVMLDHSFGIFNNVSPRFQWAELDLPFSSDDRYFSIANYAELRAQGLYPQLRMKIKDAFLILFSAPDRADEELNILRTSNLTPFDMQSLIHYLYTHVWKCTFSNPLVSLPTTNIPELVLPFRAAMRNWRIVWDEIRLSVPESEWNKLGFQRTAETYFDAVNSILDMFERRNGKFPPLPSDCEKGTHLKRLLSF